MDHPGTVQRWLVLVLLMLLVSACGSPPSPYAEQSTRNPRHTQVYSGEAIQVEELDGWWVLLTETDQKPVCLVIRPAVNTGLPIVRGGYAVSGEGGFYMYIAKHLQVPFFGFYGSQPFGESRAELDGQRIRYTDDRDTVLGWEGRQVAFQVWTDPKLAPREAPLLGGKPIGFFGQSRPRRPGEELGPDADLTTGEVDFSGVSRAYQGLLDCHAAS